MSLSWNEMTTTNCYSNLLLLSYHFSLFIHFKSSLTTELFMTMHQSQNCRIEKFEHSQFAHWLSGWNDKKIKQNDIDINVHLRARYWTIKNSIFLFLLCDRVVKQKETSRVRRNSISRVLSNINLPLFTSYFYTSISISMKYVSIPKIIEEFFSEQKLLLVNIKNSFKKIHSRIAHKLKIDWNSTKWWWRRKICSLDNKIIIYLIIINSHFLVVNFLCSLLLHHKIAIYVDGFG